MGSTYASGDLYPAGLLAFENAVQISHILKKIFKKPDVEPRGRRMTGRETTPTALPLPCPAHT